MLLLESQAIQIYSGDEEGLDNNLLHIKANKEGMGCNIRYDYEIKNFTDERLKAFKDYMKSEFYRYKEKDGVFYLEPSRVRPLDIYTMVAKIIGTDDGGYQFKGSLL